ncbi:MAG TPA: NAD(P)/FAD-dependent oxidoreductase [Burkholderiaceae bacterium]|nr:NAD(P)/FAD-dependent oxidoreductase [Burkholderiaceae bacterium]
MTDTDALVIGAGPAGLWQVFECGLLGLHCAIVDVLSTPGGQCIELYADKPIHDLPGAPGLTGRALTERLLEQIRPFAPAWHLGEQVSGLTRLDDSRFALSTRAGTQLRARCVFIAAGVGAFLPRRLPLDGLDAFEGAPGADPVQQAVFHHVLPEAEAAGRDVVIVGGEDAALRQVLALAHSATPPTRLTLLHRRDRFDADDPALPAALAELRRTGRVEVVAGQPVGLVVEDGALRGLSVATADEREITLPLQRLAVCLGLSPKLGPIADWGLAMARKQLVVDTARFETSVPGIHAVGDVVTYPGKRKLILSGFHEATLAAFAAAERLRGGPLPLEYTTSSRLLQQRLGLQS